MASSSLSLDSRMACTSDQFITQHKWTISQELQTLNIFLDGVKENINLKLSLAKDAILGKEIIVDSVLEDKTVIENNKKIEKT